LENSPNRKRNGDRSIKRPRANDFEISPEEDAAFTEKRECTKWTHKIMVVDVRWYAITLIINVDDTTIRHTCCW
jgi:hypothetical protein